MSPLDRKISVFAFSLALITSAMTPYLTLETGYMGRTLSLSLLILCFYAWFNIIRGNVFGNPDRLALFLVGLLWALFGISLISFFVAYDTERAFRSLSKFSISWILCSTVILTLPRRSDRILYFHKILATAWLFPIALSVYFFRYSKFGEEISFGDQTSRNSDAFIVLMLIPIFLAMIVETGHWLTRIIGGVGVLFGICFTMLTYSRTGMACLLMTLFTFLYSFFKLSNKSFRPIIFLIVGVAVAFSIFSYFAKTDYSKLFVRFWEQRIEGVNSVHQKVRIGLLNTAIDAGFSSVLGVGIGNFGEANQRTSNAGAEHKDAHNAYLGFFAETGFVGLLLITCVLFSPLFMFLRLMKQKNRYNRNKQFVPLMVVISGQSVVLCLANFFHRVDDFLFTWLIISLLFLSISSILNTESGPLANDLRQNPDPYP